MMQYDSNQIAEILPHRYPFALVDRIVDGEPGKWANFFVADQDLFTLHPEQLPDFRPRQSYYGGRPWKERKGSLGELAAMFFKVPHKI